MTRTRGGLSFTPWPPCGSLYHAIALERGLECPRCGARPPEGAPTSDRIAAE